MQLADVGNLALEEGLDPQAAMAVMAIAQTEGGLNGAVGDNGQSYGPLQFYSGGQLKNFASDLGVSIAEAARTAVEKPEMALIWALSPKGAYGWKQNGYLGDTIRAGQRQGLQGADLAQYGQHYGQVSVSPERAAQNYQYLWGDYSPAQSADSAGTPNYATYANDTSSGQYSPSNTGYVFPVVGYSGGISLHHGSVHGGSDLMADSGMPVVAMRGGRVQSVTHEADGGPGGNSVLIDGDDGNQYYYAHLRDAPLAQAGDQLPTGSLFGYVGDTGNARGTGTHLHIGIGPSILNGVGPSGGTGGDFDAVGLLQNTYDSEYGASQTPATTGGANAWQ